MVSKEKADKIRSIKIYRKRQIRSYRLRIHNTFLFAQFIVPPMSFALARQNKTGDNKTLTPAKGSSTFHNRINNLNKDSQGSIFHLQRTIDSQAVQSLIKSGEGFDFAKIGILQPKLKVSQPGDAYEQEADRVAEHVIKMPFPADSTNCEQEYNNQIQRKEIGAGPEVEAHIIHEVLNSPGHPLDSATRDFMQPRFDYDFSRVRVHEDSRAAESARAINARAYTVGTHLVFESGEYAPTSGAGRRLIAHELMHVKQQGGNNIAIQRMMSCPSRLQGPTPPGWQSYHGNSSVFHCGYRGILEDRTPTRDDPQNECFYDHDGTLVDENHPYSGCMGTPNQYRFRSTPGATCPHRFRWNCAGWWPSFCGVSNARTWQLFRPP